MAKIKPSIVNLSGKYGENIIVNGSKNKAHTRPAAKAKSKKRLAVLKKTHSRNKPLNQLASELNTIVGMKQYAAGFKSRDFYHRMQKRFRKTQSNHRFILLNQLKGMEVNELNTLHSLGQLIIVAKPLKNKLLITLQVRAHPSKVKRGLSYSHCYYEVILICWNKTRQPATHKKMRSIWIDINSKLPILDFEFDTLAGTTHWLACVRQRLGGGEKKIVPVETFAGEGMQLVEVGSYDKKELKLLAQEQKIVKPTPVRRNDDDDMELVKPRETN